MSNGSSFRDVEEEDTWNLFTYLKESRCTAEFTGSERAVQITENWLRDCVESHANCPGDHDQNLPTRLLDLELLNNTEDLKLIEKAGKLGSYAALSHCWGATQQFTTTVATLPERRERIPFVQLTKTFKKAVQTTRALGIRYLWIDSLCIIQGDPDDWAREASQMSSVYQNAMITIAAAASESGDEGLFRERSDPEYK
ncbi:HET domain-containing protein, partial [Pyrenophora tritici-repentis]